MAVLRLTAPAQVSLARNRGGDPAGCARGEGRSPLGSMRAALTAVVLATGGGAPAAPGGPAPPGRGSWGTGPAGGRPAPDQEAGLARGFAAAGHFGGLVATPGAEVHVPPRSSVALCATRATAALPDAAAAVAAARAA